jgi:hypothetical protein
MIFETVKMELESIYWESLSLETEGHTQRPYSLHYLPLQDALRQWMEAT